MRTVVWDDEKCPKPWQMGELNTVEGKMSTVEKRVELVGATPRLVCASELFGLAMRGCVQGVEASTEELSDWELCKRLRGK